MAQGDPTSSLQHSLSAAGLSAGMTHSMSSYYHPNGIAAHAHAAAAVGQMSAAHHPAFLPPHHTARDFRDAAGSLQVATFPTSIFTICSDYILNLHYI